MQSEAKQSEARQSKEKPSESKEKPSKSKAEQGKAKKSQTKAKQSKEKQSKAKQRKAKQKQSRARQSKAKQSKAKQGKAKISQAKAKQGRANQSKAKYIRVQMMPFTSGITTWRYVDVLLFITLQRGWCLLFVTCFIYFHQIQTAFITVCATSIIRTYTTPWSNFLLERLSFLQPVKKFLMSFYTSEIITESTTAAILSHINPVHDSISFLASPFQYYLPIYA